MIAFLINALKIVFVLGFLVLIHEVGHFLVAKLCKVKVNEFSIGFGPKIFKKKGKVTQYTVRLFPLGGYVSLDEGLSEDEGSFSNASIPKRMAIILAGGLINIVFGIIVYFILATSLGNNVSLVIDEVVPEYAAVQAGIEQNDEIIKVNNKTVRTKNDVDKFLTQSNGEELILTVKRDEEVIDITLVPTRQESKATGIYIKGMSEGDSTKVVAVQANSPAEKQGILANDEIITINGVQVTNQEQILEQMQDENIQIIELTLKRGEEIIQIELEPRIEYSYYLGVIYKTAEDNLLNNMYYAVFDTQEFLGSIVDNLKTLVTGNVKPDQLMGPVGISEVVVQTTNIQDYVYILALISLSLGITNLLPLPALDGGKFVLLLLEAIRRKKLSERTEMNIQLLGFTLLIMLSLYVAYNDILRIL